MTNSTLEATEISTDTEHLLSIVTHADGDLRIKWDPTNEVEVAAAQAAFDKAKSEGYLAYETRKDAVAGQAHTVIRAFDPDMARITMTPPLVGG